MSEPALRLQQLLRDARLWRGDRQAAVRAQATGHGALDALLPGGGWPCGALSEIVYPAPGVGELSLALPLLARLSQQGQRLALIAPPCRPYGPALHQHGVRLSQLLVIDTLSERDALWASEELLRAQAGAVLLWQDRIDTAAQRRLQLAAETGDSFALVYRRSAAAQDASVAALRVQVGRHRGATQVQVLKCRGARPAQPCTIAA